MLEEELQQEKEYLQNVKDIIKTIIENANSSINKDKKSINQEKRFMWENLSDYTDEERAAALSEVDMQVNFTNKKIENIAKYEKALNSPYFAKLEFEQDNGTIIPIYIGITSVQQNLDFYVFDWRAPISSLFYNYEIGKAKYDIPNGEIEGEILSKYQFKIVDGELLRCFKSDINIDDEYLQEILANSSTDKMKSIVNTIQRDQNEIIRNTLDKYLIVQGVAGSGKTSVALHRIAYLLYKDLNLSSNNILIFSPNNIFSDYISNVLPELGEENVLKTTYSDFANTFLPGCKKVESYTDFLNRAYNLEKNNYNTVIYKLSEKFINDIKKFYSNYISSIKFTRSIGINNKYVSKQEMTDMFNKYSNINLNQRIELMAEKICGLLGLVRSRYFKSIKNKLLEISNIELDFYKLYNMFLSENEKISNKIQVQKKFINYDNIMGLLYLNFEINGYPNYNHIRQIVIDEVQDYTPYQIELLNKIFKNASFTLLGDVNQAINPFFQYNTLDEISHIFNCTKYIELTKTYRSSEEIIDYSNKILGINNVCSIRRNNNIPVEIREVSKENILDNIFNDLNIMQNSGMETIAIITKNEKGAKELYELIAKNTEFDIQLVTDSEHLIKKPIIIIPSYLSKGLEFDGVIAYNTNNENYTSLEKKLYYVVCTRAQHKLQIYNEQTKILTK